MHFTDNIETCTPADQVISTDIFKTPGCVPGAPLREQPGDLCSNSATCNLPGWVPGAPPRREQPGNLDGATTHAHSDQSRPPSATSSSLQESCTAVACTNQYLDMPMPSASADAAHPAALRCNLAMMLSHHQCTTTVPTTNSVALMLCLDTFGLPMSAW